MNARVKQLRDGVVRLIAENPTVISISRKPLVDNGAGGLVEDPFGTPTVTIERVRISHEASGTPAKGSVPSGLDTSMSLYILGDFRSTLREGDVLNAEGRGWRAGPVNTFKYEGKVYKVEAVLIPADIVPVTIPKNFATTTTGSTTVDVTWEDVGAVNTYSVERKTGAGAFAIVASQGAGERVFHDSGLESSTTYTYRMRAFSAGVYSRYTPEASVTTEAP